MIHCPTGSVEQETISWSKLSLLIYAGSAPPALLSEIRRRTRKNWEGSGYSQRAVSATVQAHKHSSGRGRRLRAATIASTQSWV
jgi:hypothetical protein